MRGFTVLLLASVLILPLTFAPSAATAQVSIGINLGGPPPSCPYGYYGYAPYHCAPSGYYGNGYFYNGIFLGVGPWANYGYAHGWGEHRFIERGGGHYGPGERGYVDYRTHTNRVVVNNHRTVINNHRTVVNNHAVVHRAPAQHAIVNHGAPAAHGGGNAPHGGAASHAAGGERN